MTFPPSRVRLPLLQQQHRWASDRGSGNEGRDQQVGTAESAVDPGRREKPADPTTNRIQHSLQGEGCVDPITEAL